jgi:hypothetical protein
MRPDFYCVDASRVASPSPPPPLYVRTPWARAWAPPHRLLLLFELSTAALPTPTSHRNRSHIAGTPRVMSERTPPRASTSTASAVGQPWAATTTFEHATLRALALLSSQTHSSLGRVWR